MNKNKMVTMRPHHLFCLCHYIGKGYNNKFVDNMTKISNFLKRNRFSRCVKIVDSDDDLCRVCPHIFNKKNCIITCNNDFVYLNSLNFKIGDFLCYNEFSKLVLALSFAEFERICSCCQWFGLCCRIRKNSLKV